MSLQDELNRKNGTTGLSIRDCLKTLAGGDSNRSTKELANAYSVTTNKTTQEALNLKAGRNLTTQELLTKQDAAKLL